MFLWVLCTAPSLCVSHWRRAWIAREHQRPTTIVMQPKIDDAPLWRVWISMESYYQKNHQDVHVWLVVVGEKFKPEWHFDLTSTVYKYHPNWPGAAANTKSIFDLCHTVFSLYNVIVYSCISSLYRALACFSFLFSLDLSVGWHVPSPPPPMRFSSLLPHSHSPPPSPMTQWHTTPDNTRLTHMQYLYRSKKQKQIITLKPVNCFYFFHFVREVFFFSFSKWQRISQSSAV